MEIDIDHEMAALDRRVAQAEEHAEAQLARTGPITGKASSPDGGIEVEVAPGGLLTGLHLSPGALSADAETLARQIMALADRATKRAGGNMYQALAPVLGPSGEKHLTSLGYVPVDEDDADDDPDSGFINPLKNPPRRGVR